jgi:hypothetical protein
MDLCFSSLYRHELNASEECSALLPMKWTTEGADFYQEAKMIL